MKTMWSWKKVVKVLSWLKFIARIVHIGPRQRWICLLGYATSSPKRVCITWTWAMPYKTFHFPPPFWSGKMSYAPHLLKLASPVLINQSFVGGITYTSLRDSTYFVRFAHTIVLTKDMLWILYMSQSKSMTCIVRFETLPAQMVRQATLHRTPKVCVPCELESCLHWPPPLFWRRTWHLISKAC